MSDASLETVGQTNSAVASSEEPVMTNSNAPNQTNTLANEAKTKSDSVASEPEPPIYDDFADNDDELSLEEKALFRGEKNRVKLVRHLRARLRNDKDAIVVITGERGIGKTVLAHCLANGVDHEFDMRSHTLFDPEVAHLKDILYGFKKYSATVVDELIRIGYRRNWASVGNKLLNELYNLCRYQNQASFLCIPNFNDIDKDLQDNVTLWVHVVDRGFAVAFCSDQNPFVADKWHLRENEKLMQVANKGKRMHAWTLDQKINVFRFRVPNFVGWFTFPDFTLEEKALYKTLKVPYEMKPGVDRKVEANKAARERIKRTEDALSGAVKELFLEKQTSVMELERVTGLNRTKLSKILKEFQGASLRELEAGAE